MEAEEAGWDGFFLWDHLLIFDSEQIVPFVDPWIALTAIAANTERMRIGTMVTPVPRRRPWKLAREAVTLDHISKGRLTMGVGIGAPPEIEYGKFGEETSAKVRAEKLDEGLEILTGLWSGEPYSHHGKHYQLEEMTFLPKPIQEPRIPIWVGGGYPHKEPFRRAAYYDGVIPVHSAWPEALMPTHLEEILSIVESERGTLEGYDIVVCGETTGNERTSDGSTLEPWMNLGVTWWLEDIHGIRGSLSEMRERIRLGPPEL